MRSYCAGALGLVIMAPAVILCGRAYESQSRQFELAAVTGRVTCADRPPGGMATIYFSAADNRYFDAFGVLDPDGSFQLKNVNDLGGEGVVPGKYRVSINLNILNTSRSAAGGSSVNDKEPDRWTSDVPVQVGPGWNDFVFSLPEPGPDRSPARNR
jgi:hypothetical protein